MEKIKILTNKYKYLSFTIQHVFKANFNDTYYFETMYVDVDELADKELVWIDPFNKRSKFNNLLVALSYIDENKYIIYIKQDDKITKEEVNVTLECIVSEPFDDSVFLASHIRLTNKKVNY